jgi:hypothetical protein
MTCQRVEWSVEHACFYLTLLIPMPQTSPVVVRDVALRVDDGKLRIEPPACVDWPEEWALLALNAAVKALWAMRARNTKKADYFGEEMEHGR